MHNLAEVGSISIVGLCSTSVFLPRFDVPPEPSCEGVHVILLALGRRRIASVDPKLDRPRKIASHPMRDDIDATGCHGVFGHGCHLLHIRCHVDRPLVCLRWSSRLSPTRESHEPLPSPPRI